MSFFSIFGLSVAVVLAVLGVIILVLTALIWWTWYTKKIILPKTILVLMSILEWPVKLILYRINVDKIMMQYLNKVYTRTFTKIPFDKRTIFLPQCVRDKKCPAKLTDEGIKCVACGKCDAYKVKDKAEKLGYKFFIVPGSSFVKRMMKKYKPKAVIGVACYPELQQGMKMAAHVDISPQCVPLMNDGCINTVIDMKKLDEVLSSNGKS